MIIFVIGTVFLVAIGYGMPKYIEGKFIAVFGPEEVQRMNANNKKKLKRDLKNLCKWKR